MLACYASDSGATFIGSKNGINHLKNNVKCRYNWRSTITNNDFFENCYWRLSLRMFGSLFVMTFCHKMARFSVLYHVNFIKIQKYKFWNKNLEHHSLKYKCEKEEEEDEYISNIYDHHNILSSLH